ncbi:MAG: amino acid permease [Kordiimonadaceae bacterium]|nr:amino acid permease [Kordiimonadaceae bacterium]MBO6567385.1 amino acid permease [Kordiimonadaceae bacterium]MBO6963401.1 amino acid permease [Kordiimonadaceae bacterium]
MDHQKVIGKRDIVLFCISAILLIDTVATGAAIGASSIFWWVFLGVIFFVPFSLISAELGCTYPDQGGIYAWVQRAFGARWATRVTWSYWVNVAVWLPSLSVLFAGIFAQLFWPEMPLSAQIAVGVGLSWLTVLVNIITLEVGKWVPNIGAIIKIIVFTAVICGAAFYYSENGAANDLSLAAIAPDLSDGLQYLPVIIYGMLGFELICAGSDEIQNPEKNVPSGVLISGAIIICFYLLATVAVLVAVPVQDINLVEGLVDTLTLFFGDSGIGGAFVTLLAIGALYTFFSNGATWAMGANRAAAEAAIEGELPAFFAVESKSRGTPVGAAIALGISSTIILVLYGFFAGSNQDLFWSLFAFSGVIFIIPYVGMMFAYIKLRRTDPDRERPFKVGGPSWLPLLLASICSVVLILTIILFNYVPGDGMQWKVFWGALTLLIIGEVIVHTSKTKSN